MYGQYGIGSGMNTLASMLQPFGRVTMHQWDSGQEIVNGARLEKCVIIIGFSLGGNQAPAYGAMVDDCDLTISYDPSIYSPLAVNGVQLVSQKIGRAVCYWNRMAWMARGMYGGARLSGRNVVEKEFRGFHLNVHNRMDLHNLSVQYVREATREVKMA